MRRLLKVLVMLFICRLILYMPILLNCPSKDVHSEDRSIRLTPLITLQAILKTFLVFWVKPSDPSLQTRATFLILVLTSIESVIALRFSTVQFGFVFVGLAGLLTAGSMVLMWLNEQISLSGIGSGATLIILFRLLVNVPSVLLSLKNHIGKHPTPSILLLTALSLLLYFSILTELIEQRITTWVQKPDRKYTSYFSVSLAINVFPLALASVTSKLQAKLFEKVCLVCAPLFKLLHIQELINPIETTCGALFHVGLMIYFCVIFTRWDTKASNVSDFLKRNAIIIDVVRPGIKTKEHLSYLFRELTIAKALCISLGCAVIRMLSLFTKQVFVLNEFTAISLMATTLDLAEHLKFYVNFIRYNNLLKP